MALADETDPRETVRLILDDDAADADYTNAGAQPDTIEVIEATERNVKTNRTGDAIYVWRPADADLGKFGAAGSEKFETAVVQAEAYTTTSAAQADALAEDIQSLTGAYANDSQQNTQWVDIFPIAETDFRHEKTPDRAGHFVVAVQVRLRRLASI